MQVGALHAEERADLPGCDPRASFAHHGVKPVDKRHGCDDGRRGRSLLEIDSVGHGGRERLLTHDVLASGEGAHGQRVMGGVRGDDVHDVDVRVGEQGIHVIEGTIGAHALRSHARPLGRRA